MEQLNHIQDSLIESRNGADNQQQEDSSAQRSGKWTEEENLKYAIFMDFHKNQLSSRQKRREYRMFDHMASFIGSRTSIQCRSHHQKFENKFRGIKAIINFVKQQSGKTTYKASFKEYKPILARMRLDQHRQVRPTANVQVQTQINWVNTFRDESLRNNKPQVQEIVPKNTPLINHQTFPSFQHPYYLPMFFPHF